MSQSIESDDRANDLARANSPGGEMWSDRISAADSEESRRELLSEAARWRAKHLGDVSAMRRATFAIARLHALVGDRERAVGEAKQLLSLCQTSPPASDEEIGTARGLLVSLGETPPRIVTPPRPRTERPARADGPRDRAPVRDPRSPAAAAATTGLRGARPELEPRGPALTDARRAAGRGEWDQALRLIDGARGGPALLLRTYVQLSMAMASNEPREQVEAVRNELGRAAGVTSNRPERTGDGTDPLSVLLGAPVPSKRAVRIRLIEQFADDHPERIDELASAALQQHVGAYGAAAPAPWLVGVVARAMAVGDAPLTRATIAELQKQRAVAVHAYDEWPFERLLRLLKRAEAMGHTAGAMRRGILARGEPDDRKLWTLRLNAEGVERMVAVAPHASAPYEDGAAKADELAARLQALCSRTLLLATGSGNAGLRASSATAGLAVRENDADDDALIAALVAVGPSVASDRGGAEGRGSAGGPPPPERLTELLQAEVPDVDALAEAIRTFRRPDRALRVIQRMELDDVHTAAVLRAVDRATEPGRAIPEATTLAIRSAARGEETRKLLAEGGAIAERFAGPHALVVIDLAKVLLDGGWDVHRVLRGPTRRECTAHPALETLSGAMSGMWRLLVRHGDRKGEVWYLADLPPEGRAGVPLLLLEDWQRVVVVPQDPELLAWWRTLGAAEPVAFTGTEGAAVLAALESFVVRADPAGSGGSSTEEAAPSP